MRYTLYKHHDKSHPNPYHIVYNGSPKLVTQRDFKSIEDAVTFLASSTQLVVLPKDFVLGEPINHFNSPANAYPEYFI